MKYQIKTRGLHCGHCDASVEAALLKVAGVTDADADHETNTVEVECTKDTTPESLTAAIEGASESFAVVSIETA